MNLLAGVAMTAGCLVCWAGLYAAALVSVPLGVVGLVLGVALMTCGLWSAGAE